jgi:NAD(P)-dependent dehydrogenase (short-subunit alcohol dehydrogenase family)
MTGSTFDRPLAVITCASSGIGLELARQFAEHGFDLLIAAEDPGIQDAAAALRRNGGPAVLPVQVDLATYQGVEDLFRYVDDLDRPVEAIAINAAAVPAATSPATPSCATS